MIEFALAALTFGITHSLPMRPRIRARLVRQFGSRTFWTLYGLVSLVSLAWLIDAAARAPYIELWAPAAWQRWVPFLIMPIVFGIITFTIAAPNPLSFGGRHSERFDPSRPGIAGFARHPLLLSLALWAFAHVMPNVDLAHVLLFGALGLFALISMTLIDRRRQAAFGLEEWTRLARGTSNLPFWAWITGRSRPGILVSVPRVAWTIVLWACLISAHARLFGVSPWPV
jgi:uncharacterized membrane protein